MSTHPAITPTCANHRRRWHDLGERGWADHAALEYPHGHRVALGEGGMRRSEVANLPHAMRAAGQDDACRRLLARDPVGHGQLHQAARCRLCLVERRGYPRCSRGAAACTVGPSRGSTRTVGGPIAAWCGGAQRRLTDA
jgi:hypothetical protein